MERLFPLRYTGGLNAAKAPSFGYRALHSDVLARAFNEDNAIPADTTDVPPYVLGVVGHNPAPPVVETSPAGPFRSRRVREIRRHEVMKIPSNPKGVLKEPPWKS